jgi:hypothetical protein
MSEAVAPQGLMRGAGHRGANMAATQTGVAARIEQRCERKP